MFSKEHRGAKFTVGGCSEGSIAGEKPRAGRALKGISLADVKKVLVRAGGGGGE